MTPFLPDTPWSEAAALILLLTCIFVMLRDRTLLPVVAVLFCNWLATRAVSAFDLSASDQAIVDLSSAMALVLLRKGREFSALPTAALFATMVSFSFLNNFGVISRDTLWAWSDVLGYLQLAFVAGGAAAGGGGGRARVAVDRRGGNPGVAHAVAQRVQHPPVS